MVLFLSVVPYKCGYSNPTLQYAMNTLKLMDLNAIIELHQLIFVKNKVFFKNHIYFSKRSAQNTLAQANLVFFRKIN